MSALKHSPKGFTLIELLLVMGIIGTLAAITIVAINPTKQLNATKDVARLNEAKAINNALTQYLVAVSSLPSGIGIMDKPICKQGITTDSTCVNLDTLVPTYIAAIPRDASETTANYTGYLVKVSKQRPVVTSLYHSNNAGLVARWTFDDGSGTTAYDSSSHNYTGTFVPFAQWSTDSKEGTALDLVGSNYMNFPSSLGSAFTTEGTLSVWIKLQFDVPASGNITGFGMFGNDASNMSHYPFINGYMYSNIFRSVRFDTIDVSSVNKTQWHHLAVTSKPGANGYVVYLNGTAVAATTGENTISMSANPRIGLSQAGYYMLGKVDDLRLYNRALTAQEIQSIYAGER